MMNQPPQNRYQEEEVRPESNRPKTKAQVAGEDMAYAILKMAKFMAKDYDAIGFLRSLSYTIYINCKKTPQKFVY